MRLMIFYPGGVSYGALPDDADNDEIREVLFTAATIEEGNGSGRIKERERPDNPTKNASRAK